MSHNFLHLKKYKTLNKLFKCTVILFDGSTTNIRLIKSLALGLMWSGVKYIPDFTFDNNLRMFSSSNGKFPVNRAYKITPQLQTSAAGPSYFIPYKKVYFNIQMLSLTLIISGLA